MLSPADRRTDIGKTFRMLNRRNRVIGLLRIVVPALGLLVLVVLLAQIILANISHDFGIAGVRVDRDRLVLDAPEYAGVMANGTHYEVAATAATTLVGDLETVHLDDAVVTLVRTDGYETQLRASAAAFSLVKQTVQVPDILEMVDSRNMRARMRNAQIDWQAQTFVARDNVHIVFDDGSILTASGLDYDASAMVWAFRNVKLTLVSE